MHKRLAILVLALATLAIFVPSPDVNAQSQPSVAADTADDGWRYTSHGWEHVSTWQSLDVAHEPLADTNGRTPVPRQIAGVMLIVGGLLGLGWLLAQEIDPLELRAFRLHRQ